MAFIANAQVTITTKQVVNKKSNIEFTDEWQYLTTDFYLFNEGKFNDLINKLGKEPKTNIWGKLKSEKIEFLSLTANILNVEFYDNQDLIYPLYNFKIDYSKKNQYKTQISDEIEVIRLIDNLPLATSKKFIDAKIEGEAITDSKGNQIMRMVSDQLNNISKLTDPSSAVLTVVGELGSFLESSSRKKQYQFNSTIRLYDDTKFSKKIHSINVYVYLPKNNMNTDDFNSEGLINFIDTIKISDNVDINRSSLSSLVDYSKYPFFVVVNYKSKYTPQKFSVDEIDDDYISAYEQRILDDCNEGLSSEVVCNQVKELVSFFNLFTDFKQSKQAYDLNYENGITSELNKNLFLIMKDYREILLTKESRDVEFKDIPSYTNDFEPRYNKLILIANQYLSESPKLSEVRTLVTTTNDLRNTDLSTLDELKLEKFLSTLYSLQLPEEQSETDEYGEIIKLRGSIEKNLFERIYNPISEELKSMDISNESINKFKSYKEKINTTNCKLCRTEVNKVFIDYQNRWDNYLLELELTRSIDLQSTSKDFLTETLINKECITNNIDQIKENNSLTEAQQFVIDETTKIFTSITKLKEFVNTNISQFDIDELISYNSSLTKLNQDIKNGLQENCERLPELCQGCN